MASRLKELFKNEIAPQLMRERNYRNFHQLPTLKRIFINAGVGQASATPGLLEDALKTLTLISGQKAVPTHAKKAISNFKIKTGQAIGCKVSLSGVRMWEFFDRFINVAIPRIRDFRGLPVKGMDGNGNLTIGIKEQIIFHEIDRDKIKKIHGLDITIITSANTDEEGLALLKALGVPFRKDQRKN